MFQRIQQYELMDVDGYLYRPRAYGDRQPDGRWDGWLVFFPIGGRRLAIAPPGPETTQSTWAALSVWAVALSPVYLEGALARARAVAGASPVIAQLTDAEYEALEDAERLETAADVERSFAAEAKATVHERFARNARAVAADAERRHRAAQARATGPTHTKKRGKKQK